MQQSLPLNDHVEHARALLKRVKSGAEMFITRVANRGGGHTYYLSERYYPGVEVEWTTLVKLNSRQEALDIKAAGVCEDWFDCLKE